MKIKIFAIILSAFLSLPVVAAPKQKVYHTCKPSDTKENILACNIYRESRGDGTMGMLASGFATLNRKSHPKYPDTIRKIVYQPNQFSWTNHGKIFKVTEKDSWDHAKSLAKMLLKVYNNNHVAYMAMDITGGATHYHTTKVRPKWAKKMQRTAQFGSHIYYKERNK